MVSNGGLEVRLLKDKRGWHLQLYNFKNHRVLNTSESYVTKWNAKRAARKAFPGLEVREVVDGKE